MEEEYREITLADIVRTLYRRKLVLGSVFLLSVLAGVAVTVFAVPEYEASASVIPLEHADIIKNWLDSRSAAAVVVDAMGDPLLRSLYPDRWDVNALNWTDGRPDTEDAAIKLAASTTVETRLDERFATGDRKITVTVRLTDALLARDAADAFIASLEALRPDLEGATENRLFAQFYTQSGNEQEARQNAENIARNTDYWIPLDAAATPSDPSSPNVTLNIALSIVLGLMLGVFAVFAWEWARNFRAETRSVEAPPLHDDEAPERPARRYS